MLASGGISCPAIRSRKPCGTESEKVMPGGSGVGNTIVVVETGVGGNAELITYGVGVGCEAQDEMTNANAPSRVIIRLKYLGIAPDYKPIPR